jgi:hypothetical protein
MSFDREWFCLRCQKVHPIVRGVIQSIVRGVIQCDAPPDKPLTGEQMREAVQWAADHPLETSEEK